MDFARLVRRSLTHYWRTNVAVVLGVATAVAVLAGALLVGHSVRASLADLVRQRLGATDLVLASPLFFREQLAADVAADPRFAQAFRGAVPLVVADAVVTEQESGRRAGRVKVYGVDERFWQFHGVPAVLLEGREAALSPALAREIGAVQGKPVLIRVQRPSDIPLESLHARKDDVGRTLRLTTRAIVEPSSLGEFSLDARQGDVMAAFVPLARLQQELEVGDRANTVLFARQPGAPPQQLDAIIKDALRAEDAGLTVRASDDGRSVIVGSVAGLIDERQSAAVFRVPAGPAQNPVFTYLANTMRVGGAEVPYSLVTGMNLATLGVAPAVVGPSDTPVIVLNSWAAQDLKAKAGDTLSMDYYVWEEPGQLVTRSAQFRVGGIVPIEAGGRDLAPDYPGISNTSSLSDWDPPFPLDLRRVRPVDEDYWDRYRATPKAFVEIGVAQKLWGSRYGSLTSLRLTPLPSVAIGDAVATWRTSLGQGIEPEAFGLVARDVRGDGLAASQGATDFGEYFVYFSFFLVVSALVLVVLFFKLGVEQRAREVGLLRAVGLSPRTVRRLFTTEACILAVTGSLLGAAGAVAYAGLLMTALTTWWVDAVGTTDLRLHVSLPALAIGAIAGVLAAVSCIWWTLRRLRAISERSLLAGDIDVAAGGASSRYTPALALLLAGAGVALVVMGSAGFITPAGGFFGAGAALLVSALMCASVLLRRPAGHGITSGGAWPVARLAMRNAAYRPGRSVLSMAIIASATFVLVTVDAFRRDGSIDTTLRGSGTGGYQLMVPTLLPIVHDPNAEAGRDALNLLALDRSVTIEPFRVRPGDDASCLNLYQPTNPRIIAPRPGFVAEGRFSFQASAAANAAEKSNPWTLLDRVEPDGAIPVIGDANSMTYVLHRAVGDDFVMTGGSTPVRLRFVGALRDSIFQSEVLMSEANFRRLFPDRPGYQLLLVETASADPAAVAQEIERSLSDAGADAVQTGEYLASFHRVENTYLSTFQTLGGLGLLLGTVGLATVLLRNVLERRRELGLLAAVGYRRSHFLVLATVETALILAGGLAAGALCAAVAIAPAVAERGARFPFSDGVLLLVGAVFAVAMLSSLAAMAAVTRTPLLSALRTE